MKKLLKKQTVRNLLMAVLVGAFYSLFVFLDQGRIDAGEAVSTITGYFLVSSLLSAVAPKLRKLTGHEQAPQ